MRHGENMVKPHEDRLKKYWELVEQTKMEPEQSDFQSEETLEHAIEIMEQIIKNREAEKKP